MNISQRAFSRRIEKLEEALGVELLDHTTRRVTLTAAGSRHLLNELKVAFLHSQNAVGNPLCSTDELIRLVTSTAAELLGWNGAVGSITPSLRADLLVCEGTSSDP